MQGLDFIYVPVTNQGLDFIYVPVTNQGPDFIYVPVTNMCLDFISFYVQWVEIRGDFVDIGEIVDHHCSSFIFIIHFTLKICIW